jgi:hypothetical protein
VIRGQDGDIFHRAVVVLLLHLEPVDTYLRRCVNPHDDATGCGVYSDFLANQR